MSLILLTTEACMAAKQSRECFKLKWENWVTRPIILSTV